MRTSARPTSRWRRAVLLVVLVLLVAGACSDRKDRRAGPGGGPSGTAAAGQEGAGDGGGAGGGAGVGAGGEQGGPGRPAEDGSGGTGDGGEDGQTSTGTGGHAGDGGATSPQPARKPGWRVMAEAPIKGRHAHSAVWTGKEMIVWGGATRAGNAAIYMDDGAAYDPATDRWRKLPPSPLAARGDHFAAWTGREMLVWGGNPGTDTPFGSNEFTDGAAYDPARNRWEPTAEFPLAARYAARAVWAGGRLVVWGGARAEAGEDPPPLTSGAAYDPDLDRWTELPQAPVEPRLAPLAASVDGDALFSWGFTRTGDASDGARFDIDEQRWARIAAVPESDGPWCFDLAGCVGVDTGERVLFAGEGLVYDPAADRWSTIAASPFADPSLDGKATAWTGRGAVVWGGGRYQGETEGPPSEVAANPAGMLYDPATDTWTPVPDAPITSRARARGIWTGAEFVVWGGESTYRERIQHADGAAWTP